MWFDDRECRQVDEGWDLCPSTITPSVPTKTIPIKRICKTKQIAISMKRCFWNECYSPNMIFTFWRKNLFTFWCTIFGPKNYSDVQKMTKIRYGGPSVAICCLVLRKHRCRQFLSSLSWFHHSHKQAWEALIYAQN